MSDIITPKGRLVWDEASPLGRNQAAYIMRRRAGFTMARLAALNPVQPVRVTFREFLQSTTAGVDNGQLPHIQIVAGPDALRPMQRGVGRGRRASAKTVQGGERDGGQAQADHSA